MAVRDQREARARENKHAHKGIDIPSCPGILAQLMEELRQPQVSGKHIATLIGKDVGDTAEVRTPGGEKSYEILSIRYV